MKKTLLFCLVVCFCLCSVVFAGNVSKYIVSKLVLEKAVSDLAEDLSRNQPNVDMRYTHMYGIAWSAGVFSRHAVIDEEMKKKDGVFQGVKFWDGHKKLMDAARNVLKNPEILRATYFAYKSEFIVLVRQKGFASQLKDELKDLLPFFNGTVNPRTAQFCEERRLVYASGKYAELVEMEQRLMKNHGLWARHFNSYEWVLRRKAEGGQPLVDAWAEIIGDMMKSL